jgi:hypothetical protein
MACAWSAQGVAAQIAPAARLARPCGAVRAGVMRALFCPRMRDFSSGSAAAEAGCPVGHLRVLDLGEELRRRLDGQAARQCVKQAGITTRAQA